MAATLNEVVYLAGYPAFRDRVDAAMVKAAISVAYEAGDSSERSLKRKALSNNVLTATKDWAVLFARAVAANATIVVTSTDAEIEGALAGVWDAIAGAPPAP